jgi:hypothetical protein
MLAIDWGPDADEVVRQMRTDNRKESSSAGYFAYI